MELKYIKPDSFYEELYQTLDKLPLKNKAEWFIKQKYLGGFREAGMSFIEMLERTVYNDDETYNNDPDMCRRCKCNLTTEENRQIEHKDNWIILERCKAVLKVVDMYHPDLIKYTTPLKKCLDLLAETHQNNYLTTLGTNMIQGFIESFIFKKKLNINTIPGEYDHELCIYSFVKDEFNFKKLKEQIQNQRFEWKYSEDAILDMVRREVSWQNIERDITIYKERKKRVLVEELTKIYHVDKSTISKITKKVEGEVNYIKGHLFEQEYKEYLKSLKTYDKVDKIGESGQPDIIAHKEDTNQVDIYSLKMLKITKKSYFIPRKELAPEYKIAYDYSFHYKTVNLFLVVFDYIHNKVKTIPLDWKNPKDVIYR